MSAHGEPRARARDLILAVACWSLAACSTAPSDELARVPVESNGLGVSSIAIDHRIQNQNTLLEIRGFDNSGKEIAIATLRTGRVRYSAEPGLIPDESSSLGTELRLSVGEDRGFALVTPDLMPHEVAEPPRASLASFIRLREVAARLAEEAGIRFVQADTHGDDRATTCSSCRFPTNLGAPLRCCQQGQLTWHIPPNAPNRVAQRQFALACRQSNGISTKCGVGSNPFVPCAYGPCGARADWIHDGSNPAMVFFPTSQPTVCGYDASNTSDQFFFPEPFTNQPLYPGVAPSCPYRACLVDGTPVEEGFALTVTGVADGATGDVTSKPSGIFIAGVGDTSWGFEGGTVVSLRANPDGARARAVFSGACSESGEYGKKATCDVPITATQSVTVTYQCEPGFTCSQ
jgi:hypothetical protein